MAEAIGPIISAGANLLSGWLGRESAEKNAQKNIDLQKEFAQTGIQWKVADAKAAGINPYYALGASTSNFSPVSISDPLPESISKAGQNVGRAVAATMSSGDKVTAFQQAAQQLDLEGKSLQNDLLRSQIARINQQTGPSFPTATNTWMVDGQGNSTQPLDGTVVQNSPWKFTPGQPGAPWSEPGAVSDTGWARTSSGGYAPVPPKNLAEQIEDNQIAQITWAIRNQVLPGMGWGRSPPPGVPIGKGEYWTFDPFRFEYVKGPSPKFKYIMDRLSR